MSQKKKTNSWVDALKLFNADSNTWCIPKKDSFSMKAVKNIQEYTKLSNEDKKKHFKASPISKEGMHIMNEKKFERKIIKEGSRRRGGVDPIYITPNIGELPSHNEYDNYKNNILLKSHKKYYGVGVAKSKAKNYMTNSYYVRNKFIE